MKKVVEFDYFIILCCHVCFDSIENKLASICIVFCLPCSINCIEFCLRCSANNKTFLRVICSCLWHT